MKWTEGLKDQLTKLAFAEKSNKEIAEIMDIPLKEVHAGRSRFGLTIAKVKAMKEKEPLARTEKEIEDEIKKVKEARRAAYKKIKRCDERLKVLEKEAEELSKETLIQITRS